MLVVIPSAGIGSRLGQRTQSINKTMLLAGSKPVISRIIESYPNNAKFLIGLGHKGDHIKEFLNLAYPQKKIQFIRIKKFKGKNSSLTHTLKKLLPYINEEFFFHANDTIVQLDRKLNTNFDSLVICKKNKKQNLYRSAIIDKKNYVKELFNKTRKKLNSHAYTGVSFIKDFKLFKNIINQSVLKNGEFEYFVKALNKNKVMAYKATIWHDIGNEQQYLQACKYYEKKSYLKKFDESIFFLNNKVYKFFSDPNKITQRYKRAKYLKKIVPNIIEKKKFFYVYKYINGKVLSEKKIAKKECKLLLNWAKKKLFKKNKLSKMQMENFKNESKKFYYYKTNRRINTFRKITKIQDKVYLINNKKIPKLKNLIKKINWKSIYNGFPAKFHGDFHFENIIKKNNNFKLIDWRDTFSEKFLYGDMYYDLAKLNHSFIVNHEKISKGRYQISIKKNNVRIAISRKKDLALGQKIFYDFLIKNKFDIYKVNILTGLIFLNIACLHDHPYSEFLYFLGLECLYKTYKENQIRL